MRSELTQQAVQAFGRINFRQMSCDPLQRGRAQGASWQGPPQVHSRL